MWPYVTALAATAGIVRLLRPKVYWLMSMNVGARAHAMMKRVAIGAGLWIAVVLFTVSQFLLTYTASGNTANWPMTLRFAALQWAPWLAVAPIVVWLSGRAPIRGRHRVRNAAAHVVGTGIAAGTLVALTFAVRAAANSPMPGSYRAELLRTANSTAVVYWMLVAAAHAAATLRHTRLREQHVARLQAQLVEARLAMLQTQLNPHFLFNTLHAVGSLMHDDPDAAEDMLTTLSDLLRLTLERGERKEVPLREDIAFLERYLEIHQNRLGERLRLTFSIAPETTELLIPSFVLQPVVENAIRHGINRRRAGGRLQIRTEIADDALRLIVRNDGPGLTPAPAGPAGTGIGLANIRARLTHLYGSEQSLTVEEIEGGVRATIVLPVRAETVRAAE